MPRRFTLERTLRWVGAGAALLLVGWLVYIFADIVLYLLVGVVLALILRPLVERFERRGLARVPSILATFVVVIGGVVVALLVLAPYVGEQVARLGQVLTPERIGDVAASLERSLSRIAPVPPGTVEARVRDGLESLVQQERLTTMATGVVGFFANVFYAAVIVPFVAFFVLKDGEALERRVLGLVPNRYFEMTLSLVGTLERTLGRYFRALGLQCFTVGAVATGLLLVVGLDGAVVVGLFTGLANSIPYFGPVLGLAAGSLVGIAQTGDLSLIPGVFVAMALTQATDNVLLQPFYFSRAAGTHPLVILIAVLVGARLGGIAGMLVAIPLLTIARVLVREVVWSVRNYRVFRLV
ncbi:MAG: AI-2E family transporter [Bacteroidota bacterium]